MSTRANRPLSDDQLTAAVELNSAALHRLRGRLPWVQFHDDGDVSWLFAGVTWPMNTAVLARFTPATAPRRVGEILAEHLRHRAACDWIVGPLSQPPDLGRHLKAHGFSCRLHCAGMACDLTAPRPAWSAPAGVRITLVKSLPPLAPLTTERRITRFAGRGALAQLRPRRTWCFSATVDGRPVGETTLFLAAGVAGLYDVEVLEPFRRLGIGTALVDAALRQAKELGQRAAVLVAGRMGLGVYSRLGFRELCKISFWRYGRMRQL